MADELRAINYALDKELPIILWSESVSDALDLLRQACAGRPGWTVEERTKMELYTLPPTGAGILAFHGIEFLPYGKQHDLWMLTIDRGLRDYRLPIDFLLAFICKPAEGTATALALKIPNAIAKYCVHIRMEKHGETKGRKSVKGVSDASPLFQTSNAS